MIEESILGYSFQFDLVFHMRVNIFTMLSLHISTSEPLLLFLIVLVFGFGACEVMWCGAYPMIETSFSFSIPFLGFVQFRQMQIFKCFHAVSLFMRLRIFNNIYLFNVTCSCANIYVSKSFSNKWELYRIGPDSVTQITLPM